MADTLTLKGEFGHAALIQDLQASFGIHLPVPEIQMWYFVGDIYRSLIARLGPAEDSGQANARIIAFYYLRRGIRNLGRGDAVTPDTPLNSLERLQPRRFLKLLAEQTGLRLPEHEGSRIGWAAILVCFAATIGFTFGIWPFPINWPVAMLTVAFAAVLPLFDPGRFPADCRTVGDLADKAAGLNYAKLRGDGAAGDPGAVWDALKAVLKAHAAEPGLEITPKTRLVTDEPLN